MLCINVAYLFIAILYESFKEPSCNQTHDKPLMTRAPSRNPHNLMDISKHVNLYISSVQMQGWIKCQQ